MMSDDMLSQDEIDALLRGAADDSDETDYNEAFFKPRIICPIWSRMH